MCASRNGYNKYYYLKNKNYYKEYFRNKHIKEKFLIVKHYSNGSMSCNCCGENIIEFLAIDHIENNGADHRRDDKSAKNIYQYIIKNNFPSGFQILCHNCNSAKGFTEDHICPHKKVK